MNGLIRKARVPFMDRCARCGGQHQDLEVRPFSGTQPPEYNAWMLCPTTGEPILVLLTTEPPPELPQA